MALSWWSVRTGLEGEKIAKNEWVEIFYHSNILFLYRSGVYCAANACIEQVIQHGEVSIELLLVIRFCLTLVISLPGGRVPGC